ncbi:MAG: cytochrome c biogenesis protein ResB, partial [Muribaculaceae bacterium]|nr:cytochrome c biogenesis protein ResB [Muribaculaceae bacterium]
MRKIKIITISLWIIIVAVLVGATIIEKMLGSEYVAANIFQSLWFVAVWTLAASVSIVYIFKRRLRAVVLLIHLAFLLILIGAGTTFFCATRGVVNLVKAEPTNTIITDDGDVELPFSITLSDFIIDYYPGTDTPSDFTSTMIIDDDESCHAAVSMNEAFSYRGWRFIQSSYDAGENGCTLQVSHDPFGIMITYSGYLMLAISILLFMSFEYRRAIKLISSRSVIVVLFCLFFSFAAGAENPKVLPKNVASTLGELNVLYNGRVSQLQTLARDFTIKLCGSDSYKGYSAEQVFTGFMFYYSDWKHEKIIKLKRGDVRKLLDAEDRYVAFINFRGQYNEYKLEDAVKLIHQDKYKGERNSIIDADDKFNMIVSFYTGQMLKIYPAVDESGDTKVQWFSQGDKLPDWISSDDWFFIKKSWDYIFEQVVAKDYKGLEKSIDKLKKYQEAKSNGALPSAMSQRLERIYNSVASPFYAMLLALVFGLISLV